MSRTRYRFGDEHYPHFMTQTIVAWLPVFSQPDMVNIVLDSWRFLQRERAIVILGWVILENHLHWIGAGPQLGKRVGQFKSFTATSIIKCLQEKRAKTLLQELAYYKLRHKGQSDSSTLAGRESSASDRNGGNDVAEDRVHPQQPVAPRLCGRGGALVLLECP
ncbi:MAG: hypothetical protein R3C53_15410 [Pirellulaceae bacterium]